MKMVVSLLLAASAGAVAALAQTNQTGVDLLTPVKYSTDWKPHPEWYRSVLVERPNTPVLVLGTKEYTVKGPLVDMLRPPKTSASEESVDGKLRRIPILGLIVPQRMPQPPANKSKYFRWKGESPVPWHSVTQVSVAGCSGDNRIHVQPAGTLISVGF
jgi:hypothetical protein